jgi:hypothetical protein
MIVTPRRRAKDLCAEGLDQTTKPSWKRETEKSLITSEAE